MKNVIKSLLWAFALVICTPFIGVAQVGYKEPLEHTVLLNPQGDSNIIKKLIVYEIEVIGNESHDLNARSWLKDILGQIKSSGKPWNLSNTNIFLIGKYDTLSYYGDVFKENYNVYAPVYFGLGPKYVKLQIICDLNTSDLNLGDSLTIDLSFDISPDGLGPVYYDPQPQFLIYGTKVPTSTNVTKFDSPEFKIFPNPFTNVINLSTFKSVEKVTLINRLGQLVYSGTESSIETSNLISGIYTLCIYSENKIFTFKLSKL